MNKEEQEAIERLDYFEPDDLVECAMYRDCVETIKNLIEKQQKELDKKDKKIENLDEKFRYAVPDDMINELYVSKDKLTKLLQIDNIDVVHCKIKKMLEE